MKARKQGEKIYERKVSRIKDQVCDSGLWVYILSAVHWGVHVRVAQLHPWLTVKAADLWGSLR